MRADLERNGRWSGEMWQQRKDGEEFLCWIEMQRGARFAAASAAITSPC